MKQDFFQVALVVKDYDEAIDFYTNKLKFTVKEDTQLSQTKRWVVIAPNGSTGATILLAKAATDEQFTRIGNQTGGRVFLFMHTNDLDRDHKNLMENNITIVRGPIEESWGKVLVFSDLYGNLWDLIESKR